MGNEYKINVAPKILEQFGLAYLHTQIYKPGITAYDILNKYERDSNPVNRQSRLGTAIFSDLQFGSVTWDGVTYTHTPIDTALFTINQEKNIIKTVIQGRSGSVKEYIADGDFIINIKGIICGDNGKYPYNDVNNLYDFLKLPVALPVTSWLLDLFGITHVVVENYSIPQNEGEQSQQQFEINCVSDKAVEIMIKDAK